MFLFFCQHCQSAQLKRLYNHTGLFKEKAVVGSLSFLDTLAKSWAISFHISEFKVSCDLLLCFLSFPTEERAVFSSPRILMHSVTSACYSVVLA